MEEFNVADVGIDRFNDDHKRLLFYIVEFSKLAKRFQQREPFEDEWDQIDSIFPRLEKYSQHHFQAEEDLMRKHDYPYTAEHIELHGNLNQHVATIKAEIVARKSSYISTLQSLLIDWLQNHINKVDLKYKDFLQLAQTQKIIDSALFNEIVSASQLKQIITLSTPDAILVDLRTEVEQQEGIIPNSHLYPCDHNLENRQDTTLFKESFSSKFNPEQFDSSKRFFLICRSGPRTGIALETFLENDLMACELIGGIEEWKRQDYPIVPVDANTPIIS
ncbi:MAG: hemerythrin domain-containing protein [Magnetococcales bacterium]|nr:hemerythrin domain-containing protein [Magnetococcales bacterium]